MPTTFKATMRAASREADRLVTALEDAMFPVAGGVLAFEDPEPSSWTIEAIYDEAPEASALEALAKEAGLTLRKLSIEALPDIDWVKKSLEALPPIRAGRFFVAGAHDMHKAPPGALRLQIEAAQAFGTGSHPTTKGCLLALDALAKRERIYHPLDLGTGSGILTFALAKLFAVPVLGSDIDRIAVQTARENARINGLLPFVRFVTADGLHHQAIAGQAPFDLIVANILAGPLKRLARQISRALSPCGTLILSGLLADQEAYVRTAYLALGFRLLSRQVIDGWTTLCLKNARS